MRQKADGAMCRWSIDNTHAFRLFFDGQNQRRICQNADIVSAEDAGVAEELEHWKIECSGWHSLFLHKRLIFMLAKTSSNARHPWGRAPLSASDLMPHAGQ